MENSYTRWRELQEEKADQEKEEFTNLNKFAKKITQVVETADSFYDAYEDVEKLLGKFLEINKSKDEKE